METPVLTTDTEVHPIYGAIPSDGEFVLEGEILGLSADAREIVTAPRSGWIKLVPANEPESNRLYVHIHTTAERRTPPVETAA